MKVRAVLFDVDGTLVDSNEAHVDSWAVAFREAGHPQEVDDIRRQIGKGGDLLVPSLFPQANEAQRKAISDAHGRHFKSAYFDHVKPFPDARALLERVKQSGRTIILASSAKKDEVEHYVRLLEAEDLIDAVTSIDDVDASKPEPDVFEAALDKAGVGPDAAIVVGDTIYDVDAARRVGVATVAVTSGPYDRAQLKDAGALAVFVDVGDLLAGFERSPLSE
jgi:HAD superfamily hydrolase (TIGR01509 family)